MMSRIDRGIVLGLIGFFLMPAPARSGWGCPEYFDQLPAPKSDPSNGALTRLGESARACEAVIPGIHLWLDELALLRPEMSESIQDGSFDRGATLVQSPVECVQIGDEIYFGLAFYDGEGVTGAGGIGRYQPAIDRLEIRRPRILRDVSVHRLVHAGRSFWLVTRVQSEGSSYGYAPGLLRYVWENDEVESFEDRDDGPCGFEVADLAWKDDSLWVATELAVARWDGSNGSWTRWDSSGEETSCDDLYRTLYAAFSANDRATNGACDLGTSTFDIFETSLGRHRPTLLAEIRGEPPPVPSPTTRVPPFPHLESVQVRANVSRQEADGALVFAYAISAPLDTRLAGARFRLSVMADEPIFDPNKRVPEGLSLLQVRPDFPSPLEMREAMSLVPVSDPNGWKGSIDAFHFATWRAPSSAAESTGPVLVARALPGLVIAFVEPDRTEEVAAFRSENAGTVDEAEIGLQILGARTQLVVPGPVPAPNRIDLWAFIEYIEGLASAGEKRGWVDSGVLEWRSAMQLVRDDLLMARFGDAVGRLDALLERLDEIACREIECERSMPVTSEGYALLYFNVEFLRDAIVAYPDRLSGLLEGGDKDSLRRATSAIGALGPAGAFAAPILIRSLQSSDQYLRQEAITALGSIRSDKEEVAAVIVDTLGQDGRWTTSAALSALRGLDGGARRFAVDRIRTKLASSVPGSTGGSATRWVHALASIDVVDVGVLPDLEIFRHDADPYTRASVATVAASSGPGESAARILNEALGDENPIVREMAARGFARWGRSAWVPPVSKLLEAVGYPLADSSMEFETALLEALGSDSRSVASFAIVALANLESPSAEATDAVLASIPSHPMSLEVLRSLARSDSDALPRAVEKLLEIAATGEDSERNSAAYRLGMLALEKPSAIPLDPLLRVVRQWAPNLTGQSGGGLLRALRSVAAKAQATTHLENDGTTEPR